MERLYGRRRDAGLTTGGGQHDLLKALTELAEKSKKYQEEMDLYYQH